MISPATAIGANEFFRIRVASCVRASRVSATVTLTHPDFSPKSI